VLFIVSENTDVYYNLAAEEYMLHHFTEDVLMLWRSKSAVVCGKHQNLCAEMNFGFCKENGIQPARRLSGGGTVYHDLGNINFTFIHHLPEGLDKAINFRRFLDPVRTALLSIGVNAEYSQRNDLLLNGKKISGNAEHVFQKKKRVLHHGTLLFDSDLSSLKQALHAEGVYTDKAVKSVRSEVVNIKTVLPNLTSKDFLDKLCQYWDTDQHTIRYVFCGKDVERIENLRDSKFSKIDWVVHYSPKYEVVKKVELQNSTLLLKGNIANGMVEQLVLEDVNDGPYYPELCSKFIGLKLDESLSLLFAKELSNLINIEINPFILF